MQFTYLGSDVDSDLLHPRNAQTSGHSQFCHGSARWDLEATEAQLVYQASDLQLACPLCPAVWVISDLDHAQDRFREVTAEDPAFKVT